jgi:hypothetical protein
MKNYLKVLLSLLFLIGSSLSLYAEEASVFETNDTEEATETESVENTSSISNIEGGGFDMGQAMEKANTLGAYFGYSNIGGESVVGFRVQPDLQIGKLGIGLDIPVQFNLTTKKFRTDEFQDGVGLLRMIRFLSWGIKKQDNIYFRVGELNYAYLGYGGLIDNYSNSISFDKRKIGVDLDFMFNKFLGIEILYSDVNLKSLNLLGVRPYIRPLAFTGIPIIKTFDIGFQYVTDRDNTGAMVSGDATSNHNTFLGSAGMSGQAVDMGMLLLNMPMVRLVAYGSLARLQKNTSVTLGDSLSALSVGASPDFISAVQNYNDGYGASAGLDLRFKFLGNILRMDAKVERLWYTDNFIPHFFDVTYEMNKDARILSAVTAKAQQGVYADLALTVLDKILVSGGMMMPDNMGQGNPALLRLKLDGSKLSKAILLEGEYVKGGLTNYADALTLDERSLMTVRAAYGIAKMFYVGVDYNWTWANVGGKFVPSSYWAPYVGMKFDLGFLNKN